MTIVSDEDTRHIEAVKAVLALARSNFPRSTNVVIKAVGENSGEVSVPYYVLLRVLEAKPRAALTRRAEAAEASLAALRDAAKPFAKIADDYDDREDGALLLRVDADQLKLTLGQCRAVRALLTDPTQSTQDDDSPVPAPTPDMGKVEEALEAAITCLRQAPAERREPATLIVCQAALSQLRSPNDG